MSLPRLRAPKEHGQILAVPPLDQVGALLDANHRVLTATATFLSGKPLNELRDLARREVSAAAARYHREAGEPISEESSDIWIVAGHQPELFHPGVWFKNFALHQLARRHGAAALNLIVDTDSAKPAVLHAPAGERMTRVPFDRSAGEMPYEERGVEDERVFADLPARMSEPMSRWNFEPMLASYWVEVMKQAARTPLLGERLAAARRAVERRWGVVQREVPMSRVCQTEAFAWFACDILDHLPEFHAVYNQTVQAYRREHGIHSRNHPVPDLTADGDWLEAPFWAWHVGERRRGKLFVRRTATTWELHGAGASWPSLPGGSLPGTIEAWRGLEAQGFKVRARALTTTMFARLFLADLFIHGIGGGIYDELTDRIIEAFFGIPAPGFLVLSATLLLPLPRYPNAADKVRVLARRRHDLEYKPERFVEINDQIEPLIRTKRDWIARECASHAERVERFHHIRAINSQLQPNVLAQAEQAEADYREQTRLAACDELTARRDYAFCLFPEEMLRSFFTEAIR